MQKTTSDAQRAEIMLTVERALQAQARVGSIVNASLSTFPDEARMNGYYDTNDRFRNYFSAGDEAGVLEVFPSNV